MKMLLAAPVLAQEPPPVEICADVGLLAEAVMDARKSGVSLAVGMEISAGNAPALEIVMAAWEYPRMNVAENRQRAVSDFRDDWHLMCLRALGGA